MGAHFCLASVFRFFSISFPSKSVAVHQYKHKYKRVYTSSYIYVVYFGDFLPFFTFDKLHSSFDIGRTQCDRRIFIVISHAIR